MDLSKLLKIFSDLLPVVHTAIKELEPLFPNAHQGAAKADAAVQIVSAILPASGEPDEHVQAVQQALPAVVGAITAARAIQQIYSDPATP